MSDYSATFPSQRPVFSQDFAQSGKIDPRATFSRSDSPIDATKAAASAVHYWSNEKHLSSENLLPYSENLGLWSQSGLESRTGGQTDPAGGSTGFTLQENTSTGIHRISQNVTASGDLAFTVYAKQGSGTRYLTLALYYATGNTVMAVYDLAGGSPVTATGASSTYTSVSASQTASGDSYYKCVLKATGSATVAIVNINDVSTTVGLDTNWGTKSYTGDGTSSIRVSFSGLNTISSEEYVNTSGQVARSYAPKLKSVSTAGAARFEYDPTDGQSVAKGILLEGQSSNLNTYSKNGTNSSGVYQYSTSYVVATPNAAVAPDGTLSATLLAATDAGSATVHSSYANLTGIAGSTAHTMSVYAKAAGHDTLVIHAGGVYGAFGANIYGTFTLTGSGTAAASGGTATAQIESCGNGWFRCSLTETTASSPTGMRLYYYVDASSTYQGDDYSGLLLWGFQTEAKSFASSWVDTGNIGYTATRAADSLSVTDASIFNGGEHSVYWEGSFNGSIIDPRMFSLSDGTNDNRLVVDYNDGNTPRIRGWADGTLHVSESATGQTLPAGSSKIVGTLKTNESRLAINGTQYASDTTGIVVGTMDRMAIGSEHSGGNVLNGHVKRVAYYSTALSQTEIETLTS